jgi:hypothetical protein
LKAKLLQLEEKQTKPTSTAFKTLTITFLTPLFCTQPILGKGPSFSPRMVTKLHFQGELSESPHSNSPHPSIWAAAVGNWVTQG